MSNFWFIEWLKLDDMILNEIEEKFSSVIVALEDILANPVPKAVKAKTMADHVPNS